MRFGCCTNMVATKAGGTGAEHIEQLAEAGYDYIELPLAQIMELSENEFDSLKNQLTKLNIPCEACNNFFPAGIRLTGREVNMDRVCEYVNAALSRAYELGAKVVVFGSAGAKNVPEGFPVKKAMEQLVFLLQFINSLAKTYGITIAIEPLNRKESNIVNTLKDGLTLAREVDRDNIRLLADYYHLTMEKEDVSILDETSGYLHHIHFAEPEGRVFPQITEKEEYLPFLKKLKELGYNGRISIEAYSHDLHRDFAKGLECLKTCSERL